MSTGAENLARIPDRRRRTGLATKRLLCLGLLLLLWQASAVFAAGVPSAAQVTTKAQPPAVAGPAADDPLGRGTPEGTVLGFMRAMSSEDYERAVEYLDTKQSPKKAEQLAAELQFIIDRGLSGDLDKLSRNPEGDLEGGLPPNRERVGVVKTGSVSLDIQLERVERETEPPVWLFSADTLRQVPYVYEQLDVPFLDRYLPAALTQSRVWRWLSFLVVLPILFLLARLVSRLLMPVVRVLVRRLSQGEDGDP